MSFKIVAILKKRANSSIVEYCYVPHQWEQNNILFWPRSGSKALRDNPDSIPGGDWLQYKCKVKKMDIMGLEEAQLWEEEFVGASNTEAEESLTLNDKTKAASRAKTVCSTNNIVINNNNTEFDKLFDNVLGLGRAQNASSPATLNFINENGELVPIDTVETSFVEEVHPSVNKGDNNIPTITDVYNELQEIKLAQEKIITNFELMTNRMMSQYTQVIAISDNIYKMMKTLLGHSNNVSDVNQSSKKSTDEVTFKEKFNLPLDRVEDILSFNKEILTNSQYKNYLMETYQSIGGTEGQEEGKVVAKKILTVVFTKRVLTLFSWTGISRTSGVEKKESFQSLDGILSLFNELIQLADSRWSNTKNEAFFKLHTLKHAKQINQAYEKKKSAILTKNCNRSEATNSTGVGSSGCSASAATDPRTTHSDEATDDSNLSEERDDV